MWALWLASRRPLQSAVRNIATDLLSHKVSQQVSSISRSCAVPLTTTWWRPLHLNTQMCNVKETPAPTEEEVGGFTKLIEAMGFTGPLKYNKWESSCCVQKIKIAALRMYTCCVERVNYDDFFDRCSLPDTLNSWFLVAQLHVWMCLVRMRQEGRAGKYMCRYVVHSMWEDVEQRSKIMGIDAIHRKEALKAMTETFYAALFGYDEGVLSSDCILAAALWRNLFNCQCEDSAQLELMVEYVRKQMQFIDSLDGEDLLLTGEVKWRPLLEENAQSILKVATPTYNDAGL
ncbi:ubiquinol-cytochrome-c reductase complex assembly factor 1 isoform X1 [Hippocampus zosterae]|uniref:ubiquinol-cytochrome-c reductase complex assembly factor 1 isoform X1 n=1 Tax=Hippocampus zosterae TaxID=109293 RepID=UPI00223D6495|nr:ubiquinol-cytochrome-c reductase complex assembly factor 1 isoform X1 [Hippocampus zosterae]